MGPPGGPKHEYGSSKTSPGPGKNRNKVFSNLQHWHSVERPRFENGGTYDACFQSRALRSRALSFYYRRAPSNLRNFTSLSMSTSRTRTSDDEQIAAEIRAMREACEAGGFPLSRETTRGFVTPRNRPPPASLTNRPARTASPLRVATAPARLLTERVHRSGSHSPCMGKAPSSVPPFWSKPAGPARPFLGEMGER